MIGPMWCNPIINDSQRLWLFFPLSVKPSEFYKWERSIFLSPIVSIYQSHQSKQISFEYCNLNRNNKLISIIICALNQILFNWCMIWLKNIFNLFIRINNLRFIELWKWFIFSVSCIAFLTRDDARWVAAFCNESTWNLLQWLGSGTLNGQCRDFKNEFLP